MTCLFLTGNQLFARSNTLLLMLTKVSKNILEESINKTNPQKYVKKKKKKPKVVA